MLLRRKETDLIGEKKRSVFEEEENENGKQGSGKEEIKMNCSGKIVDEEE